MQIKELIGVTEYQEKRYLPIIKIQTQILCPNCKVDPAQLIFLTSHKTLLTKIICKHCGYQTIKRIPFKPLDNSIYQKRKWIVEHLKQYVFINPEDVTQIKKILENNLIREE